MVDEALATVVGALIGQPEKIALLLVVLAGAWRWLRELFRERKEDHQQDTLMERLMSEDQRLRIENAALRQENQALRNRLLGNDHE
ncbi:MAG: hypothetical protein F9K25_20395 [Candidatus Contendobacter sp.]|nr:MAG: hypothetical protein F9K25_20395 [Candidatus Contendobacter sp.]